MPLIIPLAQLRPRLTEAVDTATAESDFVLISRHGKTVAAIVSIEQVKRIWADEDLDRFGPLDPETGRPMGAAWVKRTGWKKGMAVEGKTLSGEETPEERKRRWWGWWPRQSMR